MAIYQIYYVIIVSFFAYKILIRFCGNIKIRECRNGFVQLFICLFSLVIYYLIVSFTGAIRNSLLTIVELLKKFFSKGYWGTIGYHIKRTFLSDNVYFSSLMNNIFLASSIIMLCLIVIYAKKIKSIKKL